MGPDLHGLPPLSATRADNTQASLNHDMDILIRIDGRAGCITLNRPRSLNMLSLEMVTALKTALLAWVDDPKVDLVLIDATGSRAFCVGGDIREVYDAVRSGNLAAAFNHCRIEYGLDALVANYPKPIVAIMNGVVMGGGLGISALASHSIATENTAIATPECSIGFSPDSGATLLLGAAPGHIGEYLGLTGAKIGPADAIQVGLANFYVPEIDLLKLKEQLTQSGDPSQIDSFVSPPGASELLYQQDAIDRVFCLDSIPKIFEALKQSSDNAWCGRALKQMRRCSPISLAVTLQSIRLGRQASNIEEALQTEFEVVIQCMKTGDFLEGVRAAVIDKDRNPKWRFEQVSDIPDTFLDHFFAESNRKNNAYI